MVLNNYNYYWQCAKRGARCDFALYAGASMTNSVDIAQNASQYAGLKMYLNQTFSTLRLMNLSSWISVSVI